LVIRERAWLSFIFAARYSSYFRKLTPVGSGSFEEKFTSRVMETRLSRLTREERLEVYALKEALEDPGVGDKDSTVVRFGKLMSKIDAFPLCLSIAKK
jgi:hypothetical protein